MKNQLLRLAGGVALAAVALGVSSTGASADGGYGYDNKKHGYEPSKKFYYNQGYKVSYTHSYTFTYEEQKWGSYGYESKKPFKHASYQPGYDNKHDDKKDDKKGYDKGYDKGHDKGHDKDDKKKDCNKKY